MLKNTSLSARQKGQESENKALQYFLKQRYDLVARNKKIAGVEVDLILRREHWLLLEVKSLSRFEQISYRLSYHQRLRLTQAWRAFSVSVTDPVLFQVCYVCVNREPLILALEDHF